MPPKVDTVSVGGVDTDFPQEGTADTFTCSLSRVKPLARDMYWRIAGRRRNGSLTTNDPGDGTFSQELTIDYT